MKNIIQKLQDFFQKQLKSKAAVSPPTNTSSPSMTLAKTQYAAGKQATAIRTVESLLQKNSDQTDALQWWIMLHQKKLEASGMNKEKAYYVVLKEANKRFNGVTIKIMLTKFCQKYGKRELALEWYYQALSLTNAQDARVIETTTALENAGWLNEIPEEIVSPIPSPMPETAYVAPPNTAPAQPAVALEWWGVDQPLWCCGWEDVPNALEPTQAESRIILFQFTGAYNAAPTNVNHTWAPEDLIGQISRAIPLYLLENIYYHSAHASSAIFPITTEGKLSFVAEKIDKSVLISLLGDRYTAAITGHFTQEKLELTHLNLKTQEETKRIVTMSAGQIGRAMPAIEQFLWDTCDIDPAEQSDYGRVGFSSIPADEMDLYLSALAQHVLVVNACYYPDSARQLQKPHRVIRHFLDLVFSLQNLQTQLILLSMVQQSMTFHSEAIKDYQEPLLAWLSEAAVNPGPLAEIAGITWEKFSAYCGLPPASPSSEK